MKKIIGILGLGSIGMRHAKNLMLMGHEVWGFDPDDKRGMELIKSGGCTTGFFHGDQTAVTDRFADMRGYFGGIVIASPTPSHHDHLAIATLSGKPILAEKPILDRVPHPALDLSTVKMVGYNLRFHSCVKKAKEWIDAGKIGQPIWANFTLGQYSEKPPYLRDGVILNWSHEIDLALYLLGDAKVKGSNVRLGRPGTADSNINVFSSRLDDMADILLTHQGECQSNIHLDYVTHPEQRDFRIMGSEGFVCVNVATRVAILYQGEKESDIWVGEETWNSDYIEEMQAFLDRCDGKETLGCTGEEGLKVLEICLEVRKQAGLE